MSQFGVGDCGTSLRSNSCQCVFRGCGACFHLVFHCKLHGVFLRLSKKSPHSFVVFVMWIGEECFANTNVPKISGCISNSVCGNQVVRRWNRFPARSVRKRRSRGVASHVANHRSQNRPTFEGQCPCCTPSRTTDEFSRSNMFVASCTSLRRGSTCSVSAHDAHYGSRNSFA